MVNISILKTVVARLCGFVIVAGFLIRPATAMGNAPANAIKNAVESTANDLTFEGQGPPIPTPPVLISPIPAPPICSQTPEMFSPSRTTGIFREPQKMALQPGPCVHTH
jgi:hypothetical protein